MAGLISNVWFEWWCHVDEELCEDWHWSCYWEDYGNEIGG